MKNLERWQAISFTSRLTAMGLGILQSLFIVRFLTVAEYGVVQIAVSIGGAFGIYQHLGLASGSTREISSTKDDTEVFKIFITSVVIRYLVTIPIAVFLFLSASKIAQNQYSESALILPLQIYAVVLLFQGVQSMLNSVIAGTKRFKQLFLYQASIALVSVALYVPLVYYFKIIGFFYSLLAFNVIASFTLAVIAFAPMRKKIVFPSGADFKRLLRELLSISLAIYVVKVIYTMWEKSGPILLGLSLTTEAVGVFAFAMLFAKKIVNVSDAITDVNLPVFSEKYVNNIVEFKELFTQNFNKVFSFIVFSSYSAIFWSTELIRIAIGGSKYDLSFPFILPLVFSFTLYSLINVIKSSIFVPAKLIKEMVIGFGLILLITLGFYYTMVSYFGFSYLYSMTYGMLLGSLLGFVFLVLSSQLALNIKFITHDHVLILIQVVIISLAKDLNGFWLKAAVYILFTAQFYLALRITKFIEKKDFDFILKKFNK